MIYVPPPILNMLRFQHDCEDDEDDLGYPGSYNSPNEEPKKIFSFLTFVFIFNICLFNLAILFAVILVKNAYITYNFVTIFNVTTRSNAKEKLKDGHVVIHRFFKEETYVYQKGDSIYYNTGKVVSAKYFWTERYPRKYIMYRSGWAVIDTVKQKKLIKKYSEDEEYD